MKLSLQHCVKWHVSCMCVIAISTHGEHVLIDSFECKTAKSIHLDDIYQPSGCAGPMQFVCICAKRRDREEKCAMNIAEHGRIYNVFMVLEMYLNHFLLIIFIRKADIIAAFILFQPRIFTSGLYLYVSTFLDWRMLGHFLFSSIFF